MKISATLNFEFFNLAYIYKYVKNKMIKLYF